MKIVLASGSPRRQQLLKQLVKNFDIVVPVGEEICAKVDPKEMVLELSKQKASEVFSSHKNCLVIGCDTVVSLNGKVLGKPKTAVEATQMLNQLSKKKHQVFTGVTLLSERGAVSFVEETTVTFRQLTEIEIANYVNSGACMDKAGAYGIQETDFVEKIDGSFSNVMGLPLEKLKQYLDAEE